MGGGWWIAVIARHRRDRKAKLTAETRRTAGIRRRQNLNADDTDLNWGFKNSTPGLNCASPYFSGLT